MENLHDNFIVLLEFMYPDEPIKAWVRSDEDQTGHYHDQWDRLMTVVEKINGLYHRITIEGNEDDDKCVILCYIDSELANEIFECGTTLMEATYKAVVEFVKWYNENEKP